MKWTPHNYQKQAVKFCLERQCGGLFLSPGLGKTTIMMAVAKIFKHKKLTKAGLVVAPLRVCYGVWLKEAQKWDDFHELKVTVLHGPDKDFLLQQKSDIYVINPEGLPWLFAKLTKQPKIAWPFDWLVIDESTKFKNGRSVRFKMLKAVLGKFRRRYILTGTPAPNGLMDIFSQVYILDQGLALGRYITNYREKYFDQTGFGGYTYQLRPGAEKQIHKRLAPLVLRMDAKDQLELPPLIIQDIEVELPPDAMKRYIEMEVRLFTVLDDERVTAPNKAVAVNKCLQIAAGGIYQEDVGDGRKWIHIHDAKTEALVDLVEELQGKPALIAYGYHHDRDRINKGLGKDVPYIGGGVSPKRGQELETKWNKGELPQLLGHPASIAHGLNLQGTNAAVIFYSLTWDLEQYAQFIQRAWRQGQKERVVVYRIISKKTIDEVVIATLKHKDKTQNRLLDALNKYRKGVQR